MNERQMRPCVLVFAGHDPSGGAGIQADIEAIAAQGAHALPIITALTVQDNNSVRAVYPVDERILRQQFDTLQSHIPIAAVKVGIVGSSQNAVVIAECIARLRLGTPLLPVVVDPVLGSGRGDALAVHDAVEAVRPVLRCASLLTPNLPELLRLTAIDMLASTSSDEARMCYLRDEFACDVLLKGGHAEGELVCNYWLPSAPGHRVQQAINSWHWPRLSGEFHGSGCTLAAAIAARLALGATMEQSLSSAQSYVQDCLEQAYQIAAGQSIPMRTMKNREKDRV